MLKVKKITLNFLLKNIEQDDNIIFY